jgi:ABC-type bacteriocin/lantibiotic exporter with double-glycine peptidase domain
LWSEFRDKSKSTATQAEEVITAFRTVKSSNSEIWESQTYAQGLTDVHDVIVRASNIHAIKGAFLYFLSTGISAPVIYYSSYLVYSKPYLGMGLGDMFAIASAL